MIALDIHPSRITLAITNLSVKIVSQKVTVPTEEPSRTIGSICIEVNAFMAEHNAKSFIGVGICLPGRIDPELEKSVFALRLDWHVAQPKGKLKAAANLPVRLDNVANAFAPAQAWFGESKAGNGLAIVNVSKAFRTDYLPMVKSCADTEVRRAIGHVQISPDKDYCVRVATTVAGETVASNTAALRYHRELAGRQSASTFEALTRAALDGEMAAIEAITRAAVHPGRGTRMLLSGIAPAEIVIVGEVAAVWNLVKHVMDLESWTSR